MLNEISAHNKESAQEDDIPKKVTVCENTTKFFEFSSIHGLKHIIDSQMNLIERIFFTLSFLFAIVLCLIFSRDVYLKWVGSSIIIGISPLPTMVEDIPFPAVTICNMNQVSKSRVKNVTPSMTQYAFIQTLCSRDNANQFNYGPESNNWSLFRELLLTQTQGCSELLLSCTFGDEVMSCDELFRPVLTDEGFCCSFNTVEVNYMFQDQYKGIELMPGVFKPKGIHAVKWSPEDGYSKPLPEPKFFPFQVPGTGQRFGLRLLVNADVDDYYCSSTHTAGFKVLVHSPIEAPKVTDYAIPIDVGDETKIIVTPRLSDATKALRDMKKELRQCIFAKESFLTYYSSFSRKNCEMECEAKSLLQRCNCIQYFMPRIVDNVTICGIMDAKCVQSAYSAWRESRNDCSNSCVSPCFELNYDIYTYRTEILKDKFLLKTNALENMTQDYVTKNIGLLNLYFTEKTFRSFTKDQLIGFTEFLSYTGGLMSLFLGFSLLSGMEILYFITLRPLFAALKFKKYQTNLANNAEIADRLNTQNYKRNFNKAKYVNKMYRNNSKIYISDNSKKRNQVAAAVSFKKSEPILDSNSQSEPIGKELTKYEPNHI